MHIQAEDSKRPTVPKGAEYFTRHVCTAPDTVTYLYIYAWHVQPNPDSASGSFPSWASGDIAQCAVVQLKVSYLTTVIIGPLT